jgi:hypothetical protein
LISTNIFAQKQSAPEFVESFYNFHRARSGIFDASEVDLHKKWFSAELNTLFQNELKREKEFLEKNPTDKPHFGDGFPFKPYEECSINGKSVKNDFKIGETIENANKTLVEVKFYQPKECNGELIETYKVELIKNKKIWLINDWIYSDNKRLSEDLKRAEY